MFTIFESARIKLTFWYLLIIATISGVFSIIVYQGLVREIELGYHQVEEQYYKENLFTTPEQKIRQAILLQNIKKTKKRIAIFLFYANSVILLLSGAASYYFAGQTLSPIEDALKEQKRFIQDASHEIKTPIAALKIASEVVLRNKKATKKELKESIKNILYSVNNLENLTKNMLTLSRITPASFAKKQIRLSDAITRALSTLSPFIKEKQIRITRDEQPIKLSARKKDIEKVLLIILDNAIAYNKRKGNITIHTRKRIKKAYISISDTGIGIPSKDKKHIFKRFYRADSARSKQQHKGYGLGLSIAQKIVSSYHGNISVRSKEKEGTTFTICMPCI